MALSYEQFFGTGSQTLFTFNFDYLSRAHVKASIDGAEVPFQWTGVYTVQIEPPAPPNAVVEVRRSTPRKERLVRFTDGSTLVATDMNTSTLQAFFLAQEAFDQGEASLAVTEDGQYSAQTRRVSNLGDPLLAQDAVTKNWVETAMTSQLAIATSAKDLALTAKASAEAAVAQTTTERVAAQTARTEAESARDSSSGHRLNAQNADNSAKAARDVTLAARDVTLAARDVGVEAKNVAVQKAVEAAASAASVNPGNLLKIDQNLGDIDNKGAARTNLGLGTSATRNLTVSTSTPTGGADGDIWVQV